MAMFGIPEAQHFCSGYAGSTGVSEGSFRSWGTSLNTGKTFKEGTTSFAELRDFSLREIERLLFLAVSQYRRAFDLFVPSASGWAQVTLYYGAFYAANSLLGMFGTWKLNKNRVLEVTQSNPGSQEIRVGTFASTYGGSHRAFWDFFYGSIAPLIPSIDPALRYAVAPVLGQVTWLIDERNASNYDAHVACQLSGTFQGSFRRTRIVNTLPGALGTQFRITEGLVLVATSFARQFSIRTDALGHLVPSARQRRLRELIFDASATNPRRFVKRKAVSF